MPTTPVNGLRLYWELTGGSGEPMVLVHGSLVDHHSLDAIRPIPGAILSRTGV